MFSQRNLGFPDALDWLFVDDDQEHKVSGMDSGWEPDSE